MTVCHFELGRKIRTYRTMNNLSTANFANLTGLSAGSINNIENANRDFFNLGSLNKISEVLGVPVSELIYENRITVEKLAKGLEIKINHRILENPNVLHGISELINAYLKTIQIYQDHPENFNLITGYIIDHLDFLHTLASKKRDLC